MRLLLVAVCLWATVSADGLYSVEGTVGPFLREYSLWIIDSIPQSPLQVVYPRGDSSLPANTRILLNYGKYVGFPREDGTFSVNGVAPGSYIVQVRGTDESFKLFELPLKLKKMLLLMP